MSKEPETKKSGRTAEVKHQPNTQLHEVSVAAFKMIDDKDHFTVFDFNHHLRSNKGKVFQSPLDLKSEKGHNLLHEIADRGRVSLCIVILALGWWRVLAREKVSEDSSSEHRGCTPLEIIQKQKARKVKDEFEDSDKLEKSLTPLMKACRSEDVAKVKSIIANSTEPGAVFYTDNNGWNALFWAVTTGNPELVQELMDAGVDPLVKGVKGETLLHVACMLGQVELVELLLKNENLKFDPHLKDGIGKSSCDRVAENGDIQTLDALVRIGHPPKSSFLVLACFNGRKECVHHCLTKLNMDIDGADQFGRTCIHRAVESKREEMVRCLIEQKANLTKVTVNGRNILHMVAESGSVSLTNDFIELLKKDKSFKTMLNQKDRYSGSDLCFLIRGRDRGRDAWHYVEVKRSLVPIFLKRTKTGNVDVAMFGSVLRSGWGVSPDQENAMAIEEIFKERRLSKEAKPDMTPLHIAAFKGHLDIVKTLLNHGADVSKKDSFGLTPMMLATSRGHLEMVKELEKAGAKFDEVNNDHQDAVGVADENEHSNIVNYVKGKNVHEITEGFVQSQMTTFKNELSAEKLDEVRASGHDVKQHVVSVLRDLRIDINQYLTKIGSGPVLEASDE